MKIKIFVLLLFLSAIACGQNLNKALTSFNAGNYQKAAAEFEKQIPAVRDYYGDLDTTQYAKLLFYTAYSFEKAFNYQKAIKYYSKTINIYEHYKNTSSVTYLKSIINLSNLYSKNDKYQEALFLNQKALKIAKQNSGKNSIIYAVILNNNANIYESLSLYFKALSIYHKLTPIIENGIGKNNSFYVKLLINTGRLYTKIGEYNKAMSLLQKASELAKKLNNDIETYTIALNNLATLLQAVGEYDKALNLLLRVIKIRKQYFGENNLTYAIALNNAANLYRIKHQYTSALKLFLESSEIFKETFGANSTAYAVSLNNIASLYQDIGQYEKALPLMQEALKIKKKTLGKKHPDYAFSLNNLANLYFYMKQYKKSISLLQTALVIIKQNLGEQHPSYANSLNNLAISLQAINKYSKALHNFIQANTTEINLIKKNFSFMSDRQKMAFWTKEKINFNYYNSFYFNFSKQFPELGGYAYNNALFQKGLLLRSSVALRQTILQSGDKNLIHLYDSLQITTNTLNKQLEKTTSERTINTDSLTQIVENLQNQLANKSKDYSDFMKNIFTTWQDIQKNLKPNQAAIEYLSFLYVKNDVKKTDSIIYAAIIIRKNYKYPIIIPITVQDTLIKYLSVFNEYDEYTKVKGLYFYGNHFFYNMLWKPIEKNLQGINEVFVSPVGYLYRIPLSILQDKDNIRIMDKYKFHYLTTTSNIQTDKQFQLKPNDKIVLFGGINYDAIDTSLIIQTSEYNDIFTSRSVASLFANKFSDVPYLPGTKKEVDSIYYLGQNTKFNIKKYEGDKATENIFKSLNNSNIKILHIATHGFYIIDDTSKYYYWKAPMNRSGLLFSGANLTFGGKLTNTTDDGILTAKELSQLNFYNTDLIVLSACQTALGDVNGNEGIYGLQRAIKSSGIDFMIITLWSVSDYVTYLFMRRLYKNLFCKMDIEEAFNDAVSFIRNQGFHKKGKKIVKNKDTESEIYFWAPFILIK